MRSTLLLVFRMYTKRRQQTMALLSFQNRYQEIFYFKRAVTSRGKYRYYNTRTPGADCLETLPEGYEIHEHPLTATPYLRKIVPQLIFPDEKQIIQSAIAEQSIVRDFILDTEDRTLTVFTCDINAEDLKTNFSEKLNKSVKSFGYWLRKAQQFSPQLKFTLEHEITRLFKVSRRSMVGFRENWIHLESSSNLSLLANQYCFHLGRDSFYRLRPQS